MSVTAVSWALAQKLPPIPKLVLIALCERANKDTGECWPGIETVAKDACLSPRSIVTYIAELEKNGFVMKRSMRGKNGRHRTNHYWIMFDRPEADWLLRPKPKKDEDNDESEPCANDAHGEDASCHAQTGSSGPDATGFPPHIMPEPSVMEPEESSQKEGPPAAPPSSFDRSKRQSELDRLRAAEEARTPKHWPVIEGSKPWLSWVKHGHPKTLVGQIIIEGRRDRGWYFPTLYPQPATGPPAPRSFMTADDEDDLINMG